MDEPSTMNVLAFPDFSLLSPTRDYSRFCGVLKRKLDMSFKSYVLDDTSLKTMKLLIITYIQVIHHCG